MRCTYVNAGTPFIFRVDKFSKHPHQNRGATMLQIHAELTLEAQKSGRRDVFLLDENGEALGQNILKQCAKLGKFPA